MRVRIYTFSVLLCGLLLLTAPRTAAQDNPDDKPHIQPKGAATPTPTPKATPAQATPNQYERPPFPGDAPGTRPTDKSPNSFPQSPGNYERPPFPGDTPGTSPTGAPGNSSTGESSSQDSEIDITARPERAEPAPPEKDERELTPWDPHQAAKDVEVGEWYLKLKNYRAALERFNHALVYKPNDAEATYGLAVTQEKLGLPVLASQNYHKYLETLPNGPKAKEANEAIERLGPQVASVKPAAASADAVKAAAHHINVGETYLSGNHYDAARERFEDALRLNPDNPLGYFRLAQSLQGMQRLDPARMYYRKYLELEPKGKYAKNAKKAIGDIDWILGK